MTAPLVCSFTKRMGIEESSKVKRRFCLKFFSLPPGLMIGPISVETGRFDAPVRGPDPPNTGILTGSMTPFFWFWTAGGLISLKFFAVTS